MEQSLNGPECQVIDLETDVVSDWDKNTRKMLIEGGINNEYVLLEELLRRYIRMLPETVYEYDNPLLSERMLSHMEFFNSYFAEFKDTFLEKPDYYEIMEDLLCYYCKVQLDIIKHRFNKKGYSKSDLLFREMRNSLCMVLKTYLGNKEIHVIHTLLKLNYDCKVSNCRDFLNEVYSHCLLHTPPESYTDQEFCRNYLLFQKWKDNIPAKTRSSNELNTHEIMNRMCLAKFGKQDQENFVTNNELMKIILQNPPTISQMVRLFTNFQQKMFQKYLMYIKEHKEEGIAKRSIPPVINLDPFTENLGDIETTENASYSSTDEQGDIVYIISDVDSDIEMAYEMRSSVIPRRKERKKNRKRAVSPLPCTSFQNLVLECGVHPLDISDTEISNANSTSIMNTIKNKCNSVDRCTQGSEINISNLDPGDKQIVDDQEKSYKEVEIQTEASPFSYTANYSHGLITPPSDKRNDEIQFNIESDQSDHCVLSTQTQLSKKHTETIKTNERDYVSKDVVDNNNESKTPQSIDNNVDIDLFSQEIVAKRISESNSEKCGTENDEVSSSTVENYSDNMHFNGIFIKKEYINFSSDDSIRDKRSDAILNENECFQSNRNSVEIIDSSDENSLDFESQDMQNKKLSVVAAENVVTAGVPTEIVISTTGVPTEMVISAKNDEDRLQKETYIVDIVNPECSKASDIDDLDHTNLLCTTLTAITLDQSSNKIIEGAANKDTNCIELPKAPENNDSQGVDNLYFANQDPPLNFEVFPKDKIIDEKTNSESLLVIDDTCKKDCVTDKTGTFPDKPIENTDISNNKAIISEESIETKNISNTLSDNPNLEDIISLKIDAVNEELNEENKINKEVDQMTEEFNAASLETTNNDNNESSDVHDTSSELSIKEGKRKKRKHKHKIKSSSHHKCPRSTSNERCIVASSIEKFNAAINEKPVSPLQIRKTLNYVKNKPEYVIINGIEHKSKHEDTNLKHLPLKKEAAPKNNVILMDEEENKKLKNISDINISDTDHVNKCAIITKNIRDLSQQIENNASPTNNNKIEHTNNCIEIRTNPYLSEHEENDVDQINTTINIISGKKNERIVDLEQSIKNKHEMLKQETKQTIEPAKQKIQIEIIESETCISPIINAIAESIPMNNSKSDRIELGEKTLINSEINCTQPNIISNAAAKVSLINDSPKILESENELNVINTKAFMDKRVSKNIKFHHLEMEKEQQNSNTNSQTITENRLRVNAKLNNQLKLPEEKLISNSKPCKPNGNIENRLINNRNNSVEREAKLIKNCADICPKIQSNLEHQDNILHPRRLNKVVDILDDLSTIKKEVMRKKRTHSFPSKKSKKSISFDLLEDASRNKFFQPGTYHKEMNITNHLPLPKDRTLIANTEDHHRTDNALMKPATTENSKIMASVLMYEHIPESNISEEKPHDKPSNSKIMYTSMESFKSGPLVTDFQTFESNYIKFITSDENSVDNFEDSFSGPVSITDKTPNEMGHHNSIICEDKIKSPKVNQSEPILNSLGSIENVTTSISQGSPDSSRSNSPSPQYELISDFATDFKETIARRNTVPVHLNKNIIPKSILKKTVRKSPVIPMHTATKLSLNISEVYEKLKRRNDTNTTFPKRQIAFVEKDLVLIENERRCKRRLNQSMRFYRVDRDDPKLNQLNSSVRVPKFSVRELLKYNDNLPSAQASLHITTRSCILTRIERPTHSPSRVPDPVEYLNENPETGTVDYTKHIALNYQDSPDFILNNEDSFNNIDCITTSDNPLVINSSPEKALNLIIPTKHEDAYLHSEFSNSPKFLQEEQLQNCIFEKNTEETTDHSIDNLLGTKSLNFLSDNSNFYTNIHDEQKQSTEFLSLNSNVCNKTEPLPENKYFVSKSHNPPNSLSNCTEEDKKVDPDILKEINKYYDYETEIYHLIEELNSDNKDTRLPFKKRRMSVSVKEEPKKEEISYPATPMISIAEVEALHSKRTFKTPAERKEMPPLPSLPATSPILYQNIIPSPVPVVDQFNINSHTYNPTINYHLSAMPFIQCAPYYPVPPILIPFNNIPTYETKGNLPHKHSQPQPYKPTKKDGRSKKEKSNENYFYK